MIQVLIWGIRTQNLQDLHGAVYADWMAYCLLRTRKGRIKGESSGSVQRKRRKDDASFSTGTMSRRKQVEGPLLVLVRENALTYVLDVKLFPLFTYVTVRKNGALVKR